MLLSSAARCSASRLLTRTILTSSRCPKSSLALPKPLVLSNGTPCLRTFATATKPNKPSYIYPPKLNIFNSGFPPLFVHTITRFTSLILLGAGIFWAGNIAFDGVTPLYYIPIYLFGSAVPLVLHGLAVGGFVHHVHLHLPPSARKSKEGLMRYLGEVGKERQEGRGTKVQIKAFWFRPWAHTRNVNLNDLRRLRSSRLRITNLEQQPANYSPRTAALAREHPRWYWLAQTWMGRMYVARDQMRDRSRAPGVWNGLWEQIPMLGKEGVENKREEREVVRRVISSKHEDEREVVRRITTSKQEDEGEVVRRAKTSKQEASFPGVVEKEKKKPPSPKRKKP